MKGFGEQILYLVRDVGTTEINGEVTHAFEALYCIINVRDHIEKLFNNMLNNYGSSLQVGYHAETEKYNLPIREYV